MNTVYLSPPLPVPREIKGMEEVKLSLVPSGLEADGRRNNCRWVGIGGFSQREI